MISKLHDGLGVLGTSLAKAGRSDGAGTDGVRHCIGWRTERVSLHLLQHDHQP